MVDGPIPTTRLESVSSKDAIMKRGTTEILTAVVNTYYQCMEDNCGVTHPTTKNPTASSTEAPVTSSHTKAPVTSSPIKTLATSSPTKAPVTSSPTGAPATSTHTGAPVISPTEARPDYGKTMCQDASLRFPINNKGTKRNCKWAGKNVNARCGKNNVAELCPVTCGEDCTSTARRICVLFWRQQMRDCAFFAKKAVNRCT